MQHFCNNCEIFDLVFHIKIGLISLSFPDKFFCAFLTKMKKSTLKHRFQEKNFPKTIAKLLKIV